MAGFLELFTRYVDQVGGDPIKDAAEKVRFDLSRDRVEADTAARDIERIWTVLGGGEAR